MEFSISPAISHEASPASAAQHDSVDATPRTAREIEALARQVLKEGARAHARDDYNTRLERLATDYLPQLTSQDQGRLIAEIYEQDGGASESDSWLQAARSHGNLEHDDRMRLYDAVAAAYTNQDINSGRAWEFFGLQDLADKSGATSTGIVAVKKALMVESASDEFRSFLKTFTTDQLSNGQPVDQDQPIEQRAAQVQALVSGLRYTNGQADLYGALANATGFDAAVDAAANGFDPRFGATYYGDDANWSDPFATIVSAVANGGSTDDLRTQEMGIDIASAVREGLESEGGQSSAFFSEDNKPDAQRQDALREFLGSEAGAGTLKRMVGADGTGDQLGEGRPSSQVSKMAALFRVGLAGEPTEQTMAIGARVNDVIADVAGQTGGGGAAARILAAYQRAGLDVNVDAIKDKQAQQESWEAIFGFAGFLVGEVLPTGIGAELLDSISNIPQDALGDDIADLIGSAESDTDDAVEDLKDLKGDQYRVAMEQLKFAVLEQQAFQQLQAQGVADFAGIQNDADTLATSSPSTYLGGNT